jgi:4-hydroxy-tetrahydrodipicolinate synthase
MTDDEKLELWRAVSEAVTIPCLAGSSTSDTAHSVHLTRLAVGCGVAGILAVTPYYNRPSQAGIEAHFRAMAAASDLPVVLYDIPFRTGRKVAHETLLRLARDVPTIVGVKDAAGDVQASARLIAEAPDSFELYSGDDGLTLALLAVGAVGVVSVASHWAGPEIAEMVGAFGKGDVQRAREINADLLPSWSFQSSEATPNPVPAKAMLRALGLPAGQCRLPMGPAPAGLEDQAREVLAALRS